MPMTMEDDLDDLFGDAPSLHIPRPLPKGLLQRIDDLRLSGCRQRIAWSKLGSIAYISDDSSGVCTRHLCCKPSDGQWTLSEEVPINGVAALHGGVLLVHVSWNQQGNELAVFDSLGKISISTITYSLCEFSVPKRCLVDAEDNLNEVVGHFWLNTDKPLAFNPPAQKRGGQWSFSPQQHKALGPFNPLNGGSALVTITRGAAIRMIFQGTDRGWHQVKAEIEKIGSPSELITHATICADRGSTMLLATRTSQQHLMFYRVTFNFQRLSFDIQHLKIVGDCFPTSDTPENYESSGSGAQLTHLEYFPQGPENAKGEPSKPYVLAAFASLPDTNHDQGNREPSSIVCRWQLESVKPQLHPQFEQLSKKPSSSSPHLAMETVVKRLPDTFIPKVFLSVQQVRLSTLLEIAFSDGTIELRDRITMDVVPQDNITEQVSGLRQVGFDFPQDGHQLHVALSPNACAVVYFAERTDVCLGLIEMPPTFGKEVVSDPLQEAATEALTLHFSTASYQDDLVAVTQLFSQQNPQGKVAQDFLSEIYRVLEVRLDHAVDPQADYLFRNVIVQRCVGMQLALGYSGERETRPLPAKLAQAFLDVRSTTLIMMYALKSVTGAPNNENDARKQQEIDTWKTEELQSTAGLISWCISLMSYIVDEIFELSYAMETHGSMDTEHLQKLVHASNNPSLPLLLISSSRTFLRYLSRYLSQFDEFAKRSLKAHSRHSRSLASILSILDSTPLKFQQFDKLLVGFDTGVKAAYQASNIPDAARKKIETEMLLQGSVPEVLKPALETLLGPTMEALKLEVDIPELFFVDFSWLELGDDKKTRTWMKENRLDVVRKTIIPLGKGKGGEKKKVKRCSRCCAMTEDLGMPVWARNNPGLMQLQRNCLCGGWWMGWDGEK